MFVNSSSIIHNLTVGSNPPLTNLQSDHFMVQFSLMRHLHIHSPYAPIPSQFRFSIYSQFQFYSILLLPTHWSFVKTTILCGCELFVPKVKKSLSHLPGRFNEDTVAKYNKLKLQRKKVNRSSPTVHNVLNLKSLESSMYESQAVF